jgi:hypothetical protein
MNKKVNIDLNTITTLYQRYKDYALPVGVIFVCFIIFVVLILPQVQSLLSASQEEKLELSKLSVLKNNLNIITTTNDSFLDSELNVLSQALPPNKDFTGILDAISLSANKSGVSLGQFEFTVGDLSKVSPQVRGFTTLEIILSINGGITGLTSFLDQLSKTLPLSDVVSIQTTDKFSTITLAFYYKSFPPVGSGDTFPLVGLQNINPSLFKQIASWQSQGALTPGTNSGASSSASKSSSF